MTGNLPTNRENWKSIDGYSNYEVSWWGRIRNTTTDRIWKARLNNNNGYPTINLSQNNKQKTHKIHQLVAREWVLNPDGKMRGSHR